jgi:hypothetical protein
MNQNPNNFGFGPQSGPYGAPQPQQQQQYPSPSYAPPPAYGYAPVPRQQLAPVQPQALLPQAAPANAKSPGLAVALELLGGTFLQTFGIGHLYTGRVGLGLGLMFGYWALTALNFFLCFVFVGFITWPICWLAMMILSPILASSGAKKANAKLAGAQQGH